MIYKERLDDKIKKEGIDPIYEGITTHSAQSAVMYQNLSMGLRFKLTMGMAVLTPVLIVTADILEASISEVEGDR